MSKTLTAKVNLDTSSAIRNLNKLETKMKSIDATMKKSQHGIKLGDQLKRAVVQQERLKQATLKTALAEEKLTTQKNKSALAAERLNKATQKTQRSSNALIGTIKNLAGAYLGVMAARAAIETSDTITSAENRLNAMNGNDTVATQASLDKMYTSAQKVRVGYADMMANVSKSMTLAGDAFGGNIDNAIRFQEIMSEAYTLGGASAAEQSSSMYQLIQGLGSGILQGDELRSVREGAPIAYKEIEKFAQGIYGADQNLKDLASQGKITSDIVVAAIMSSGERMDKQFENTSMTFAQAWQNMKNTATKAFEPVLQKLNDILNSDFGKKIISGISTAITIVAKLLMGLLTLIENVAQLIADNWYWLKGVFAVVAILLLMYIGQLIAQFIILGAQAIWAGLKMFASWLMALGPIGWVILAILVLSAIFVLFTEQVVGALWWLGALFKNIGLWIANLAIGVWNWIKELGQWIANLGLAIWQAIKNVGLWFANLGLGIWEVLKACAHNVKAAFVNTWFEVKAKFWDFVAAVVSGVKKVADLANKLLGVFGLEIDVSGLENAIVTAESKAQESRDKKLDYRSLSEAWNTGFTTHELGSVSDAFHTYDIDFGGAFKQGNNTFDTFQSGWGTDAYNKGAAIGADLHDSMTGWLSNGLDSIGNLLGGGNLSTDPVNMDNLLGNIADEDAKTAKNTDKMADSMELAEEDLKYLRQIAEMEWKKEYTTASIKIDMTNNNSINGENDLDGLVTKLTDKLYEELSVVANGVYA